MQDDMTNDLADDLTVWDFYAGTAMRILSRKDYETFEGFINAAARYADAMMAERAKRRAQEWGYADRDPRRKP